MKTTFKSWLGAGVVAAGALMATGAAQASNVFWSVGVGVPGVAVGVGNAAPMVYGPQPVYMQPAPYYAPPAYSYYAPPAYYAPPRVVYRPAPVYYAPPRHYPMHRKWNRHHHGGWHR